MNNDIIKSIEPLINNPTPELNTDNWKTVKLSELFDIYNGYASSNVNLIDKSDDTIYYIRPSNTYEGTIAGYVNKNYVPEKYIFPKNTIYVSTDGEGSHSYTYVSSFDFVPNSNVAVLIPKEEMNLREKQYYALCITKNRYKFSYGRKPKGDRLANILLPNRSEIPDWVYEVEEPDLSKYKESFNNNSTPELNTDNWKEFKLVDLFDIVKGNNVTQSGPEKTYPYISSSSTNNGISDYRESDKYHPGGLLTVSANGACMDTFYQSEDFISCSYVNVLYPKSDNFNKYNAMFFIPILELEKFRFGYGRKSSLERVKQLTIKLPTTSKGEPDYQFMEDYIKTLPYSKYI